MNEEENTFTKTAVLTYAGMVLKAKIEMGNGKIPLDITRVVIGAGISADPISLTAVVDEREELIITGRKTTGTRTTISVFTLNTGIAEGHPISQIGFYAEDPDNGEILYRIYQPENPHYMPSATERSLRYKDDFNFITGNASEVIVNIDPSGMATMEYVDDAIAVALENYTGGNAIIISPELPEDLPEGSYWIKELDGEEYPYESGSGGVTIANMIMSDDLPDEMGENGVLWGNTSNEEYGGD